MLTEQHNVIGRIVDVCHNGSRYAAKVIDKVAGTEDPKRVRVISDCLMGGRVLQPHQYTFMRFIDDYYD